MLERERAIADLESEGLLVTEWRDDPGTSYELHTHARREVRIVLAGAMTVRTGGVTRKLGPGDRLDIAPNEPHEAVIGPDGVHYLSGAER